MLLSAECVLTRDGDSWVAEFPQFGGVATSGKTRTDALKAAREVLTLEAVDLMTDGAFAPRQAHVAEVHVVSVDVSDDDAEAARCVTLTGAAERIGVSSPRVTALVKSGALDVRLVNGRRMVTIESVNRLLASDRKPGRPRA